jgi:hypothetical protein
MIAACVKMGFQVESCPGAGSNVPAADFQDFSELMA